MRMVALSPVNDGVKQYAEGDEFDVSDACAEQLIAAGAAEPKKAAEPKAKPAAKKDGGEA